MNTKTKKIILAALLIALSMVLTRFLSANLPISGNNSIRLSIGFFPIMLAGIILGPFYGMAVGAAADLLGYFVNSSGGAYFPPITLTSALVGLVAYLVYRLALKWPEWLRLLLCVAVTQIICSMLLQTLWLSMLYGDAYFVLFPLRALAALILIPVNFIIVRSVIAALRAAKLIEPSVRQVPAAR